MLHTDPSKRQEFVLLFDATNSNPNGDPDAGNLPRVDPETMHGLVTDVALKRKVRDFVEVARDDMNIPVERFGIFVQSSVALNTVKQQVADKLEPALTSQEREGKRPISRLKDRLCAEYFDIRMFGAVLATGEAGDRLNAGQVRGPLQISFSRSVDPVLAMDIAITRKARTTEARMETGETEFGRKALIPYGLYRAEGYFNPFLARDTGVKEDDMEVLWMSLQHLFDFDHSAARTGMVVRGLYVFSHESSLGNAPAHLLFERVTVNRRAEVEAPRKFTDYTVTIDDAALPAGVTLTRLVG